MLSLPWNSEDDTDCQEEGTNAQLTHRYHANHSKREDSTRPATGSTLPPALRGLAGLAG
jgi:hypothetical protein